MVSKAPRSSGILTYLRQSGLPCEVGRALLPKVLKRKHKSIGDPPRSVAKAQSTGWTKIMGSLEIQPGAF